MITLLSEFFCVDVFWEYFQRNLFPWGLYFTAKAVSVASLLVRVLGL